jgi:hypothetical protein
LKLKKRCGLVISVCSVYNIFPPDITLRMFHQIQLKMEKSKKRKRAMSGNRIETIFALFIFFTSSLLFFLSLMVKLERRDLHETKVKKRVTNWIRRSQRGKTSSKKYKFSFISLERSSRYEINTKYQFKNNFFIASYITSVQTNAIRMNESVIHRTHATYLCKLQNQWGKKKLFASLVLIQA